MMILKEFSRIVCVSLFSYQGSLFVCLSDSSFTLSHSPAPVKDFFKFFSRHFFMSVCRSQATCLLYHMFVSLSTTIFCFFKTFQMNFCDSLLISNSFTLSHSFLNVKYFFEVFYFFKIQNFKRRRRDLNPRAGYPTYTLSRGTSSAS